MFVGKSSEFCSGNLERALARIPGRPIKACYIGPDAAQRLAEFAAASCGKACFVVSDENTRGVGGERLLSALSSRGKQIREKVYPAAPLDATEELGDEVAAIGQDADCFIAIGSGTLCDLAKHAGTKNKRPSLLFATAASMNGYTSGITAIKVKGLKRTMPCDPALGIFAEPELVATAPPRMAAAGVADFFSKCSSASDWRTAHFLRAEYYSEEAMAFYEGTIERALAAAPGVGAGDHEALSVILEALLLSGLSMLAAGSSSPASGGEHLISHFLDMKSAMYGYPHDLHGAQVGVATIYCLTLWERILSMDPAGMDVEALLDAQPDDAQIAAWIDEDWGRVAEEVHAQWKQKALDRDRMRIELERFRAGHGKLRAGATKDYLPPATVAGAIRAAGGPTEPQELDAPVEQFERARRFARFIRNRFTVLDLAAEVGVV